MHRVELLLHGRPCACLESRPGTVTGYLTDSPPLPPLSLRQSGWRGAEPDDPDGLVRWCRHLLPESGIRERIGRRLGISPDSLTALLSACGGDCPGAITIEAEGQVPVEPELRLVAGHELLELFHALPLAPLLAGVDPATRFLLSGSAPRLPVRFEQERVLLPLGGEASSHLLYPAPTSEPGALDERYLCTVLAGELGLPVVDALLEELPQRHLILARHDRQQDEEGRWRRVHAETLLQAMGYSCGQRRQYEGGPSLADCAAFLRRVSDAPARDLRFLMYWVQFNWLTGNDLAHAGQISLLLEGEAPRLAPFTVLESSWWRSALPRLGMAIGGEYDAHRIDRGAWHDCAREMGIRPRYLFDSLQHLAGRIVPAAERAVEEFRQAHGESRQLMRLLDLIGHRAGLALAL